MPRRARMTITAVLLLGAAPAASGKVMLSSPVTWVEADGAVGTALFQGSVAGSELRGVVEAGGSGWWRAGQWRRTGR
jgi:hypothetical protein